MRKWAPAKEEYDAIMPKHAQLKMGELVSRKLRKLHGG